MEQKSFFTVQLDAKEREILSRLADETERSRGAVVRRLITLAADLPEARRALGEPQRLDQQQPA